jgi:hypothetical protein
MTWRERARTFVTLRRIVRDRTEVVEGDVSGSGLGLTTKVEARTMRLLEESAGMEET